MEKPNYYSIITADVRYDISLSSSEKLYYAEVTALCNKSGYCNASNKYFSNLFKVHKDTISAWTTKLKDKGYFDIKYIYFENSKRIKERRIYLSAKMPIRYRRKYR